MIERDIEIAKRLSTRYSGTASFGREDAYQACIEGFLKSGSPEDEGLVVKVMRDEMHKQSVETSYLMRVPYSSWKRMSETPVQAKYTGISTEDLVQWDDGDLVTILSAEDLAFGDVEDNDLLRWVVSQLPDQDFFRLNRWLGGYKVTGRQHREINDILDKVRDLVKGEG